jgi:hypothetical protein
VNLEALAAELADDPLGVGYESMPDSAVAESLNVPSRPGKQVVPASEVRRYVLLNGLWPRIQAVASSSANPVHQGTAITILQTLAPNSFDSFRMNDPAVSGAVAQMLATMVEAGAMSADNRDAMVALGDAQISRAQELGLGTVHHLDVAAAKILNEDPDNG